MAALEGKGSEGYSQFGVWDRHWVSVPKFKMEFDSVGRIEANLERTGRVQETNREVRNCP